MVLICTDENQYQFCLKKKRWEKVCAKMQLKKIKDGYVQCKVIFVYKIQLQTKKKINFI